MNDRDQIYMHRCIELACLGAGFVAPNPMVGAVLVYENRIIGEGYHQAYGQAHAEPNCINSVAEADKALIPLSTLYVSLEPCAHFGKTPPCSDLIIQKGIRKVVVGCSDPFAEVGGKGMEKLRKAGIDVRAGVAESDCKELNKRFFSFVEKKRPYLVLKWAQTKNGMIAGNSSERTWISNAYSNRLVHQWRSEEAAILVGTNTALKDDPSLTNRLWTGKNPVRLVLDLNLRLPRSLQVFNGQERTVVINTQKEGAEENILYKKIGSKHSVIKQILAVAYQLQLQSILVEGGAQLLQSFIDEGLWDEARVITNTTLTLANGLAAPKLMNEVPVRKQELQNDTISFFANKQIKQ